MNDVAMHTDKFAYVGGKAFKSLNRDLANLVAIKSSGKGQNLLLPCCVIKHSLAIYDVGYLWHQVFDS